LFSVLSPGKLSIDISASPFLIDNMRPVISLKSDALKSGSGSATKPFIVWQLGDVNRDGLINSTDKDLVLNYYVSSSELDDEQMYLADVNKDGTVDNVDALAINKMYS